MQRSLFNFGSGLLKSKCFSLNNVRQTTSFSTSNLFVKKSFNLALSQNTLFVTRGFASNPKGVINADTKIRLNELADNDGAHYKSKRVGRGIGSGKGKTAGRGHKGQNSRSGRGPHPAFEGGQTPLYKRMRKYGFSNKIFQLQYDYLNLDRLKLWIEKGLINPKETITMKILLDTNCISSIKDGVKILGRGSETFNVPVTIEVSAATQRAKDAIANAGGNIKTIYYNRVGLRHHLKPEKFVTAPKRAIAPLKRRDQYDDWGQSLVEQQQTEEAQA